MNKGSIKRNNSSFDIIKKKKSNPNMCHDYHKKAKRNNKTFHKLGTSNPSSIFLANSLVGLYEQESLSVH